MYGELANIFLKKNNNIRCIPTDKIKNEMREKEMGHFSL